MTAEKRSLRPVLDWGRLSPLRLRARAVAEGAYAGVHRSIRRGSGVEFGGHRNYLPGDDVRFLDRRALMRHGKLLVREFETETDRGLRLLVDASLSMGYRSEPAPGAKLAFAALVAAALARITVSGSDTVSLDWIGGASARPLGARGGLDAFERVVEALETAEPGGDVVREPELLDRALGEVARRARRGSVVVVLGDFLDVPRSALDRIAALGARGRVVVCARILDPAEASFPFEGPVHLRASEGPARIETDGRAARTAYLAALAAQTAVVKERLAMQGGRLVEAVTTDDPVAVVRQILTAAARAQR